jgi:siroheme synthase
LPELSYGSIWLIGLGNGDPRNLSPLAVHVLRSADAVIHDPGISKAVLDLVRRTHYREAAAPLRAIERAIKLAEDGWRVVQLVDGEVVERAVQSAIHTAERNIPLRVVPNADETVGNEAPLGLFLVGKTLSVGGAAARPTLVFLFATPQSDAAAGIVPRPRPLDFLMSGLAG